MTVNYFDINNYNNIHQSSPPRLAKILPPTFSMEHLLQGFNGVDAPACMPSNVSDTTGLNKLQPYEVFFTTRKSEW